jgi:molybdopterin synthase sulfur carrier subunit
MPIRIFLSSILRNYVPCYDPAVGIMKMIEAPMKLEDLCTEMGIPVETVKIAMVDGRRVPLDHEVKGNERIGLFPPVGGG